MSESALLAKYAAEIRYGDLNGHAIEMTKKSLLDALGVTLAAGGLCESCKAFVALALEEGGKRESTILGFGEKAPMAMAAFANGAMAHALDFEDAHDLALVHPNASLIPAALAVAEAVGKVTGREFIAAMAAGCDIVCRLGLALKENPTEFGWYIPPILGAFGATAAAGNLLRLNDIQMLDAFALTLCQVTCSAELRYSPLSDIRAIRDAFAAKAGILSVLLARQGIKGFEHPFEGQAGLFQLYAKGNYDRSVLIRDLGKTFEGANISFKPWPSCRGTHTYIEAALDLIRAQPFDIGQIEKVDIVVSPFNKMLCEPLKAKQQPETAIDAKFSLPFVIATALVFNEVTLERFTPEALQKPSVLKLARKVNYQVDTTIGLDEAAKCLLEIHLGDHRILSKSILHAYGHPEKPISDKDLLEKFMNCAANASLKIPEQHLTETANKILNLQDIDDVVEVII